MREFWIGVISSISATLFLLIVSYYSKKSRGILIDLFKKIVRIDIDFVYTNSRESQKDIMKDLEKTTKVYLIMGRGGELQRETYARLLQNTQSYTSIKILLPQPKTKTNEIDWLEARENEIIKFDTAFDKGILKEHVTTTINYIRKTAKTHTNFIVKLFNSPDLGKIIITDNYLYYYMLNRNTHGRQNKMYRCKVGTETYNSYLRLFEFMFENSTSI